ncbi:ATP-binding protein [Streptomyces sp. NBC_00075]|uniref:ATP-binding protein n=1 Tax=Streptomyces sp. NBC_00093 TaxID=2975649 RepID=A0AAU2A5D2_9ACTN
MALSDATTTGAPPPVLEGTAHRVVFDLPADGQAVGEARHLTLAHLRSWGIGSDGCDTAVLVVSELFTNAVIHTSSKTVTCSLGATSDQLLIQVLDDGSGHSAPNFQKAGLRDEGGRGLILVKSMTERWGVGRVVWATLPVAEGQE